MCLLHYTSGIVGLNNIKANDYMNVILHALAHAGPFRDFLLREQNYSMIVPPPGDQTITLGRPYAHCFYNFGLIMKYVWI